MKYARKLLLCILLIAGCTAPQGPVHIVIMHTNDIHGQILPKDGVGGLPQIATIIRSASPDLILDAGDMFNLPQRRLQRRADDSGDESYRIRLRYDR